MPRNKEQFMENAIRVALVTGASRGIGAAAARALSRDGWTVAVNYRNSRAEAEALAEQIKGAAFSADVSDAAQTEEMFAAVRDRLGSPQALVCCAGTASCGLLQLTDLTEWKRVFSVNSEGTFLCCRAALPDMIRAGRGAIVNVSSMWGVAGASCEAAYSASKAAVIGLTKALAKEVGPSGIRVNCVAPGCVDTDMMSCYCEADLDELRCQTPLGRIGRPEEIAEAIAFLISDRASFITGQTLGVNGGFVI